MWAAGMVGVRLPSMMPGLRMEEGTMASGCLEAWSILEGLLGWAELGQWPELQRVEWASVAEQAERGPQERQREDPSPGAEGRRWEETSSQFPGGNSKA